MRDNAEVLLEAESDESELTMAKPEVANFVARLGFGIRCARHLHHIVGTAFCEREGHAAIDGGGKLSTVIKRFLFNIAIIDIQD